MVANKLRNKLEEIMLGKGNKCMSHLQQVAPQRRQKDLGLAQEREKAMAPHSNTPAWKIPWTEEPGRLQSMGSLRVGHN